MDARDVKRIEAAVDAGAALAFAAAVAFVLLAVLRAQPIAAAGGLASFAFCLMGLRKIPLSGVTSKAPHGATPVADVLAEADRSLAQAEDELVLDDILAALNPDSRVVRLFEPNADPTPGQLQTRIDRHLNQRARSVDASQALHEALAELRRWLH